MRASRREFLNWVSAGGIALSLSRLGSAEAAALPPDVIGLVGRVRLPEQVALQEVLHGLSNPHLGNGLPLIRIGLL